VSSGAGHGVQYTALAFFLGLNFAVVVWMSEWLMRDAMTPPPPGWSDHI
jgi:hypothetical protein